ncbi:MAG TPA: ABA4-like family protein [Candidatus Binatia bacterium]|nr:ABA4-like family protein [Candidatus Binatia bacterium]
MSPTVLFQIANVLPLPIWAVWILAPRSRPARALARSTWPWGILAALYTGLLAFVVLRHGFQPAAFGTLAGVMALFAVPWIALVGWVHYLCFDLFVARWMMNDAPDAGYRLAPILLLTLFFGPAGLLCYLAVRSSLQAAELV